MCSIPRVTSASQGLLGLLHATEESTSPPWAQTPASHVHLAFTARILAPECPGSAQHMPTAQLVCPGALFFLLNTPLFLLFIQTP